MVVRRTIHHLLRKRHFWRTASFSEVAELYVSRLMRMIAINMAATYTSVYMYRIGFELWQIGLYWVGYYVFKLFITMPSAWYTAKKGPKHAIFLSNLLYIPAMILLALLPTMGGSIVWLIACFQGVSTTLYNIGYWIDFSKVKHTEHAGKEMAYMNIVERVAKAVSPLIGGLLATFIDPRVAILASVVLFIFAAYPLMQTSEPTSTDIRLNFRTFPWRRWRCSAFAQFSVGFDVFSSGTVWTMFLTAVIFASSGDAVYTEIGALSSVVFIVAILASRAFGQLIDKNAGGALLRWSSRANILTHIARPFVATPLGAVCINIANEATTTGYSMAFMRGVFDDVDRSGHVRVEYLTLAELLTCLGAAIASIIFTILVIYCDISTAFLLFFLIAAAVMSAMTRVKFKLYT